MAEVPDTVDVALDALSSPSSDEVSAATEGFSAREIAAAGAARALGGGGGGGALPEGTVSVLSFVLTLAATDVAAHDSGDGDAPVPIFDLKAGDFALMHREVVTEAFDNDVTTFNYVVIDDPETLGSWDQFFNSSADVSSAGSTGRVYRMAYNGGDEPGALITQDATLYAKFGLPSGVPATGSVTIHVLIVRP